jgi:hypothetical protein
MNDIACAAVDIIDQPPTWLLRLFSTLDGLGIEKPRLTGNTANAILFGGSRGPMIEPWLHHLAVEGLGDLPEDIRHGVPVMPFRGDYPFISQSNRGLTLTYAGEADRIAFRACILPGSDPIPGFQKMMRLFYPGMAPETGVTQAMPRPPAARTHDHRIPPGEAVDAVRHWHQRTDRAPLWVEQPRLRSLAPGEQPADIWRQDDTCFKSWLVREAMAFLRDGFVADETLDAILGAQVTAQKHTHQGWKTWQHAVNATLQLATDQHPSGLRRALRLGMLLHDIGKVSEAALLSLGCHAGHGAKIWQRLGLQGISESDGRVIGYIIQNHDVFGLVDRAIHDPAMTARLDFDRMADRIAATPFAGWTESIDILADVNDADIGSLPSLRYLRPLTPLLKQIFASHETLRGLSHA